MNDEFEEINGFKPSIRRSQVDEFTEDDAYVLLYGAGDFGHGYHALNASLPGKSTFPDGWGELIVVEWVYWIFNHPQCYGEPDAQDGFDIYGEHNHVEGVVKVRQRHGIIYIATAYPLDMVFWEYE